MVDRKNLVWANDVLCAKDSGKPFTGRAVRYYNSGKTQSISTWKDGIRHGKHETFNEFGAVIRVGHYENGYDTWWN